ICWRQSKRGGQQRVDLRVAVDIRLGTLQGWQDASRRHLCLWIEARDMTCEATHGRQPQRPCCVSVGGQCRPLQGELRRYGYGFALLHERDEVGESLRLALEFVSEPLAHVHIPLKRRT